jgi:S1-C subfamily serine protease
MVRGFEVMSVQPDTFAHRLGLQPADLLVELGGASVLGYGEIGSFSKEHAPGERAEAAWVRDSRLMRGSAELGARIPVASAAQGA